MKVTARLAAARDALRGWGAALLREHSTPGKLGAAVGFGVFVGCTPFYGFQTLLGIGLAKVLRLSRLGVLLGLQISFPPVAPLLLFACAQVGAKLWRGHWLPLSVAALRAVPPRTLLADLFVDLLLGGVAVGGVLALVLGSLTAEIVRRRQARGVEG